MRADHHNVPSEMRSFDWLNVNGHLAVDPEVLDDLPKGIVDTQISVDPATEFVTRQLLFNLRAFVLKYRLPGHTVTKRVTVHWQAPASWWQHLKADYADSWWFGWFVRWRPVRMVSRCRSVRFRATWDDMAIYPWQAVAPTRDQLGPALRRVLLHTENDTEPWWDR